MLSPHSPEDSCNVWENGQEPWPPPPRPHFTFGRSSIYRDLTASSFNAVLLMSQEELSVPRNLANYSYS